MDRITLEEINEDNFFEVIELKTSQEQKKYVASNVKSLAECYLYRNDGVIPFAIKEDSKVVGFCMLDIDEKDDDVTIWRIMIDVEYQNKGIGRIAIQCLIQWVRDHTKYRSIYRLCNRE